MLSKEEKFSDIAIMSEVVRESAEALQVLHRIVLNLSAIGDEQETKISRLESIALNTSAKLDEQEKRIQYLERKVHTLEFPTE